MSSRTFAYSWAVALCACPLLAGCADDTPPPYSSVAAAPRASSRTPQIAPRPILTASALPVQAPDALETPDGLLAGAGTDAAPGAIVPLTKPAALTPNTSPDTDDPLAQTPDTPAGTAPGQKMPTAHSHWLKGGIFNARVMVRVNGLFLGTFTSSQDRDITMKLRGGINMLTLAYTPLTSTASAHLDILESEHDPPIPPLATFRSPLSPSNPRAPLPTTTQTLTFLAR